MTRNRSVARIHRTARAALAALAVVAAAAGCSSTAGGSPGNGSPGGSGTSSSAPGGVVSAPGRLTVRNDSSSSYAPALTITGARVRRGADGSVELTMKVRNDSQALEHLVFVRSPDAASVALIGGRPADPEVAAAGIRLMPGRTVVFGGRYVRAVLHGARDIRPGHPVPFVLDFSLAGLVHLQALPPAS